MNQTHTNQSIASLSGVHQQDAFGNDAMTSGNLNAPGGVFTLSTHACSGGGPNFSGIAQGSASSGVSINYRVASTTLPVGTPVPVAFAWAVGGRATAVAESPTNVNDGGNAGISATVALTGANGSIVNLSGSYSMIHNTFDGITKLPAGNLNVRGDSGAHTFTANVGQVISVVVNGSLFGGSSAFAPATTDGDAQFCALWGTTCLNPDAQVVLDESPSQAAPPASQATPGNVQALLPPRSPGTLECFQFPVQPFSQTVCPADIVAFTVNAAGTGPFTYQWRKNGAPINPASNPSAATTSLLLTDTQQTDAGMYDCLVTNPCGSLPTETVQLIVHPPGHSECAAACDSIDFNGDGLFPDTVDIDDFLSVFSGGPCSTGTCGDIDFNNDGLFPDTLDIDSLLSVFSGGSCLV